MKIIRDDEIEIHILTDEAEKEAHRAVSDFYFKQLKEEEKARAEAELFFERYDKAEPESKFRSITAV